MQADIETQSAAKFHQRHVRRSGDTGAKSSLNNGLAASERRCSAVRSRFTLQLQTACNNDDEITSSSLQSKEGLDSTA
jgi:hypothetical protein